MSIDPTQDRYVLHGRVITMNGAEGDLNPGHIYVDGPRIAAVAAAEAPRPDGWQGVPVVRTGGTIFPGLIELHNHLSYNVLPLWLVPKKFGDRGEWARHPDKRRLISGPMQVIASHPGTLHAIVRYVESKCLAGGVTTSQGISLVNQNGIRRAYRGAVRNVESTVEPSLPAAATRIGDVDDAASFKARLGGVHRLLLHLAEGVDDDANGHFRALQVSGSDWAITEALIGIHCAGLRGDDFDIFASRGGSMVWSPFSNMLLYGDTADVAAARQRGTVIALGSDWSPSGSRNLLGELKVADLWNDNNPAGRQFTARELVEAVTVNPAGMLGWQDNLGTIEAGKLADFAVIDNLAHADPYRSLIEARETAVVLVVIDGVPRYGSPRLLAKFSDPTEDWQVGRSKRVFNFHQVDEDPDIPTISLAAAKEQLEQGLGNLPQLAADVSAPDGALGLPGPAGVERWMLDLDEDPVPFTVLAPSETIRPLAPEDFSPEVLAAAVPVELPDRIELDALTVSGDDDYFDRVTPQPNLPAYVREGLPAYWGR